MYIFVKIAYDLVYMVGSAEEIEDHPHFIRDLELRKDEMIFFFGTIDQEI